jgi:uncharacterized membrane protein YcaP (DUF421 family)
VRIARRRAAFGAIIAARRIEEKRDMDWSSLIEFNVSPVELIVRGTCLYWFLFLVFRFVLRRDVGGLGVADVLLVVLIADASQNAMTGGYTSVAEGLVLVSTLVGWNVLLDWLSFRFRWLRRLVEPAALPLIRDGRILHRNLRAEFLTADALRSQLRQKGIASVADVRAAHFEGDGELSVVKYERDADAGKRRKRTPGRRTGGRDRP